MVNGVPTDNSFQIYQNTFPKFDCTNAHTLCYRLDGNPNSVTEQFFTEGNNHMKNKYGEEFPWNKKKLAQIAPGISIIT
jgi:hypothetical protein